MSKMRTGFAGRRKWPRAVLAALLCVLIAATAVGVTASAAGFSWGNKFDVELKDAVEGTNSTTASLGVANTETLYLADILKAKSGGLKGVHSLEIRGRGMGGRDGLLMSLDNESPHDANWVESSLEENNTMYPVFYYKSPRKEIYDDDFNVLMGKLSVAVTEGSKSGSGTIEVYAYSKDDGKSGQITSKGGLLSKNAKYICSVSFYGFAEGVLVEDESSPSVSYEADDMHFAEPEDAAGGKATFKTRIEDVGGGRTDVVCGYQLKKSTLPWTNDVQKTQSKDETVNTTGVYTWFEDEATPIGEARGHVTEMTADGLEAGVDYSVRAVFVTDGTFDTPTFSANEFTVKYEKPQVTSLVTGSTSKAYQGGVSTMDLSYVTSFPNTNYEDAEGKGITFVGSNGQTYTGPTLQAALYFTTNRHFTVIADDRIQDNSKWIPMNVPVKTHSVKVSQGRAVSDGWESVRMPKNLNELAPSDPTERAAWLTAYGLTEADLTKDINSRGCAFKLAVTDLGCGYTTYRISDAFTIDSTAPGADAEHPITVKANHNDTMVDLNLEDAFTVGGQGNSVKVNISGVRQVEADDGGESDPTAHPENFGSPLKSYSYSMYYLPTKNATESTILANLTKMAGYTSDNHPSADYTPWTNLALNEDGSDGVEVEVKQDGYYRIDVRATDSAELTTPEDKIVRAYFRVDLTSPTKPVATLLKQNSAGNTDLASGFSTYDNSVYSEDTVWLFAYSEPITGKRIAKFQYSSDGGQNWYDILLDDTLDASGTPQNGGVPASAKLLAANTASGSQHLINEGAKSFVSDGTENQVPFQAAVNLEAMGEEDYTAIVVRAIDENGNESPSSNEVIMRTMASTPTATSVMSHQSIELALAVGNTTMSTDTLTPDIKNAAARKINAAYYGAGSTEYLALGDHKCTWADNKTCVGDCVAANCPYKSTTTEYFTPSMVTVQGMSGTNAKDQAKFDWVRYEHTMYNVVDTNKGPKQIPTVGYVSPNVDITNLGGNINYATFKKDGETYYTATNPRIVWMGQTNTSLDGNGLPTNADPGNWNQTTLLDYYCGGARGFGSDLHGGNYDWYDGKTPPTGNIDRWGSSVGAYHFSCNSNTAEGAFGLLPSGGPYDGTYRAEDVYSKAGHLYTEYGKYGMNAAGQGWVQWYDWDTEAPQAKRIYRIIDMSVAKKADGSYATTTADKLAGYADLNDLDDGKGDMSIIALYNGYFNSSFKDWLFLYNNQPTKKEINFTINDAYVCKHTADFGGFLFNTTIRQSTVKTNISKLTKNYTTEGPASNQVVNYNDELSKPYASQAQWRLSGYIFAIGVNGCNRPSVQKPYNWRIIKIDDVNMEEFADGCMIKGGDKRAAGNYGYRAALDDILCYLLQDNMGNFQGSVPGPLPSGGTFTTLAYSNPDIDTASIRNFKLVTEGNFTSLYVYNSQNTEYSTSELESIWNDDNREQWKKATKMKGGTTCDDFNGYVLVQWDTAGVDAGISFGQMKSNGVQYASNTASEEYKQLVKAGKPTDGTVIYTPRPTVDGVRVGTLKARQSGIHTDTNCYGFGPIASCRATYHIYGCLMDGRFVYTNVSLKMNVARSLSEVVNEPQWGGADAKFIANLSDESTDDFTNPVSASQIQWRILNDDVKFIGWGGYDNGQTTLDFLDRINGDGTYISTVNIPLSTNISTVHRDDDGNADGILGGGAGATTDSSGVTYVPANNLSMDVQVDQVADYITREYYDSIGYALDANTAIGAGTPVKTRVNDKVANVTGGATDSNGNPVGKGAVYSLSEAQKMNFSVEPAELATSSANPDFPEGRWYIVHDVNGFNNSAEQSKRNEKLSDALDLKITQPGRYTIYFAPDKEKMNKGTLNPSDSSCVFDFVVNTPPVAQFTGKIDESHVVHVTDTSYDPDNGISVTRGGVVQDTITNASSFTYKWVDSAGATHNDAYDSIAISGIDQNETEWKWELLGTRTNSVTLTDETYVISSSQTVTGKEWVKASDAAVWNTMGGGKSPDGKTVQQLTGQARLHSGEVLNMYLRVKDKVAVRKADDAARAGEFGGYSYKALNGSSSTIIEQNLTSGDQATYQPLSVMSLSMVEMYNTTNDDTQITVTRSSRQTQGEPFKVGWGVNINGVTKRLVYYTTGDGRYNAYLCSEQFYNDEAAKKAANPETYVEPSYICTTASEMNTKYRYGTAPVYSGVVLTLQAQEGTKNAPWLSELEEAAGGHGQNECNDTWTLTTKIVKDLLTSQGFTYGPETKFAIQLIETAHGLTQAEASKPDGAIKVETDISAQSARSIAYVQDQKAPTAATVTTETWRKNSEGTWYRDPEGYKASNYLDVTNADKEVRVSAQGSVEEEGYISKYVYYFYKKDVSKTANQAGYETAWYYMDASGALHECDRATALNNGVLDQATGTTSATGGLIQIGKASMPANEHTASLNVAFYAVDNGGNMSAATRVEGVKLTTTKPMPPAIKASNALGDTIAAINNDCGYTDHGKWPKDDRGNTLTGDSIYPAFKNDPQGRPLAQRFATSAVTVQFTPRQAYFTSTNNSDGTVTYTPATEGTPGATLIYEDVYGEANVASNMQVGYTVEQKATSGGTFVETERGAISSTTTKSFTADGVYRVTAWTINDSGTVSDTRQVEFTIDTKGPSPMPTVDYFDIGRSQPYDNGYAESVRFTASGSTDINDGNYYYSTDNGATWSLLGNGAIASAQSHTIGKAGTIAKEQGSGTYEIQIKAIDLAGNETVSTTGARSILIDRNAPATGTPKITSSATTKALYLTQLVSTSAIGGQINETGTLNEGAYNDVFEVEPGGNLKLYLVPNEGYTLKTAYFNGQPITDLGRDATGQYYYIRNLQSDATLTAEFEPVTRATFTASVMRASHAVTLRKAAAPQTAAAQAAPAEEATEVKPAAVSTTDAAPAAASTEETKPTEAVPTEEAAPTAEGEDPTPVPETFTVSSNYNPVQCAVKIEPGTVTKGDPCTITITPNDGFDFTSLLLNGTAVPAGDMTHDAVLGTYSYTISAVDKNITASVICTAVVTRTLTLQQTTGGILSVSGDGLYKGPDEDGVCKVRVNGSVTFQLTPINAYYLPKSITIGDETHTLTGNTYDWTMPEFTEEGEDTGVTAKAAFELDTTGDGILIETSILPDGTGGWIDPSTMVEMGGSATIRFGAYPTYKITKLEKYQYDPREDVGEWVQITDTSIIDSGSYTFENVTEKVGLRVTIEKQTYSIQLIDPGTDGGEILLDIDPEPTNIGAVDIGSKVSIKVEPLEGYRVSNLYINDVPMGSRSSYIIDYLSENTVIRADYLDREAGRVVSTHAIDVQMNGAADNEDKLADKPYQFRLGLGNGSANVTKWGAWTGWISQNTQHYENLVTADGEVVEFQPNQPYTVEVKVRDRVGNESSTSGVVYTNANVPNVLSAEPQDTQNESSMKKVAIGIEANGNPAYTKYMVYWSTSPSMSNMQPAVDGWQTLNGGTYSVSQLSPGRKYYFTAIAQNNGPVDFISTAVNTRDTVEATVSPGAPAENSLYVEEQNMPGGSITLRWDAAPADVLTVNIYRDNELLGAVATEDGSYTDAGASVGLRGDSIYRYSYAYVNSAGVGSRRVAVSAATHDAWLKYQNATEETPQDQDAYNSIINLRDTLCEGNDYFSDSMTYPAYPVSVKVEGANIPANSDGHNNGSIIVRVTRTDSSQARPQKYVLGLRAFYAADDAANPTPGTISEVPTSVWDPNAEENLQTTTTPDTGDAKATWTGMDSNLLYQVFVKEIRSTGKQRRDNKNNWVDGRSSSATTIEHYLEKTYVVNEQGYYYYYGNSAAASSIGFTGIGQQAWPEGALSDYTGGKEFSEPLTLIGGKDGYIKFNRSPNWKLPSASDIYNANTDKLRYDADGNPYLYIDEGQEDTTFKLNVIAWDPDLSPDDPSKPGEKLKPTVTGKISSANGATETTLAALPQTEAEAEAAPVTLVFDGSNLATGVYNEVEVNAYDGQVGYSNVDNETITIVVNRSVPQLTIEGGTNERKLEDSTPIEGSVLNVSASLAVPEDPSKWADEARVRLAAMPQKYKDLFGTDVLEKIVELLQNPANTEAISKATALLDGAGLDTETYNGCFSGGALTDEGVLRAIMAVRPDVAGYFRSDKETYDALVAENADYANNFRVEEGVNGTKTYWIAQAFALDYQNGEGKAQLVPWLQKTGENQYTPRLTDKSYLVELVTSCGGNDYAEHISFRVMPQPSVTIESQKEWKWVEAIEPEYKVYSNNDDEAATYKWSDEEGEHTGYSIQNLLDKYSDCYTEAQKPTVENADTTPAFRIAEGTGKYEVYRLVDTKATVTNQMIQVNLVTNTGIWDSFKETGLLFAEKRETGPQFDPNVDGLTGSGVTALIAGIDVKNSTTRMTNSSLKADTTYFVWTYYKVNDSSEYVFSSDYNALTTRNTYNLSYYSFNRAREENKNDAEVSSEGTRVALLVDRTDEEPNCQNECVLTATIGYYKADDFGNIITDAEGNPVPVDAENLEEVKKTVTFEEGGNQVTIPAGSHSGYIYLRVYPNPNTQGHAVARVTLQISDQSRGYNYLTNGGISTDLAVLDAESLATYQLGLVNDPGDYGKEFKATGNENEYEYQMKGLQPGYSQGETRLVWYNNGGTGGLSEISAAIYDKKDKTSGVSTKFEIQPPSPTTLGQGDTESVGYVRVRPVSGLEDGKHEGWLCISSAETDKNGGTGEIWVHFTQVVGQSTLRGQIYITREIPGDTSSVGEATIKLYPAGTGYSSSIGYSKEPVYQTTANANGGTYEIPNILSDEGQEYLIVVERPGYLTYSQPYAWTMGAKDIGFKTVKGESHVFEFDLRLLAGDVDSNMVISNDDMTKLSQWYNKTYDPAHPEEADKDLVICDLNKDGVVNALDRSALQENMNKTSFATSGIANGYDYKTTPEQRG